MAIRGEDASDDAPVTADDPPAPSTGPASPPGAGYSPGGVPTFEAVREGIEARYSASLGAAELDAGTPAGRDVEQQYAARQRAAAARLAAIRADMDTAAGPTGGTGDDGAGGRR